MDEKTKRRDAILVSRSELRRVTESVRGRLDEDHHVRVKTDVHNNYVDVSVGTRGIYISGTKLGAELTPRKAEILALALLEAAKKVDKELKTC